MMTRLWALLIVMAVTATACGSDGTDAVDTSTGDTTAGVSEDSDQPSSTDAPSTTEVDTDFSGDDSGDFCAKAREFDENDPFDDIGLSMSPAFFEEAEELYGEVISIAPDEIRGDFETSLDGIRQMGSLLEKYEYNFFNEELGVEMDALDTAALDASGERIGTYLEEVCGIENALDVETPDDFDLDGLLPDGIDPADLEGIDPADLEGFELDPNAAQSIFESFGIDQELATCLEEEFGDDFDFDAAGADPSFMTQEVCGTTLFEILSGIGQG
jgi:hypothetical protein